MYQKHLKARIALAKIAKRESIPVAQVMEEIETAILEAYTSAHKANDQATLDKWAEIPSEGQIPSALELITYLGEKVHNSRLS